MARFRSNNNLQEYWLADPLTTGKPWSLFPEDLYDLYHFEEAVSIFDFNEWPLFPGDFIYLYSGIGEYSHMFIVTEVDEKGRTYTVTNQKQSAGDFLVQNVLLYDPSSPISGAFKNSWTQDVLHGRTGLGGFDVLRRKIASFPPGSLFEYVVNPGDTLPQIASKYSTTVDAILEQNQIDDPLTILVRQPLSIPVNLISPSN